MMLKELAKKYGVSANVKPSRGAYEVDAWGIKTFGEITGMDGLKKFAQYFKDKIAGKEEWEFKRAKSGDVIFVLGDIDTEGKYKIIAIINKTLADIAVGFLNKFADIAVKHFK